MIATMPHMPNAALPASISAPRDTSRPAAVDVALLLEGGHPFARTGAPGWAERMIRAFPQTTFAIVLLADRPAGSGEMVDALPDNVRHLQMHLLHDEDPADAMPRHRADEQAFAEAARWHDLLRQRGYGGNRGGAGHGHAGGHAQAGAALRALIEELGDDGRLSEHAFLHSRAAWDTIVEQYRRYCTDVPFSDYIWTVRAIHRPLWRLARIAATLMPARVYHAASTGYAGLLGAMLRYRHDRPLLVSQHAARTREHGNDPGYCRDLSLRFFASLGRVCYDAADEIVALYEGNRRRQVQDGAPASRTRTIPDGIDLPALAPLRARRPPQVPQVLCLAGGLVPRKDVKTFIRAMLTVVRHCPDAQGWIAGPEDEDADYARECRALVQSLGLAGNVHFFGARPVGELLPQVGVLVLSSISEALPLQVLEAFAAGVPCVVTDVGACRELIDGVGDEDMALGVAGAVVRIGDAAALAREAVALLGDGQRWRAAQRAAIVRAERYYTQHATLASYRQLYQHLAAKPHADAGARGGVGRPVLPATPPAAERQPAGRCPFAGAP